MSCFMSPNEPIYVKKMDTFCCVWICLREGLVIKRSGGHLTHALQCIGNNKCCFHWSQRWMVVKDSFLLFINRDEATINGVMLFDPEFKAKCSTDVKFGISIKNSARWVECGWFLEEVPELEQGWFKKNPLRTSVCDRSLFVFKQRSVNWVHQRQTRRMVEQRNQPTGRIMWLFQSSTLQRICPASGEHAH